MKLRICRLLAIMVFVSCFDAGTQTLAQNAYIPNGGSDTISLINTGPNAITTTIPVGSAPFGVAVAVDGSLVYVTNQLSNTVSVIDTSTNAVATTIPVNDNGCGEFFTNGIAVNPRGNRLYVTEDCNVVSNAGAGAVSVIDMNTNGVVATILVGVEPDGVVVTPDGTKVYVASAGNVSVIDAATNTISVTVPIGAFAIAVSPDGTKVYVASDASVSVIDTSTNAVAATITVNNCINFTGVAVSPDGNRLYVTGFCSLLNNPSAGDAGAVLMIDPAEQNLISTIFVGGFPIGVGVTPAGNKVYIANEDSSNVSVIDAATNTVTTTISVGNGPRALGVFIQPALRFTGTPGKPNCHGKSVSALVRQYGGLDAAAAALGYSSVQVLQNAIRAFCAGAIG